MNEILLLIGGNLGRRETILKQAREMIGREVGMITDASSIYETEPWGFASKNPFLNQVIRIETVLDPHEILEKTLSIEEKLGRLRNSKGYSSRLIDIDILLIDGLQIHDSTLQVPHPRLHQRKFTLVPMREIASDWVHPVFNKTISEIADQCEDKSSVKLFSKKVKGINKPHKHEI